MKYDSESRTIHTQRLLLRPFSQADVATVTTLCNNYNVYKSTLSLPYPYTAECASVWIAGHKGNFDNDISYEFAVSDRENGELYGCIGISNNLKHKNGEVGYWIGEKYWGRGYGSEALQVIIEFAFNIKDYHKIYARHYESNPASGRVMQKAGMVYEGKQVDQILKEGKYETVILYGIICTV